MKGIFGYDSPLGQVLNFIADLLIVNVLFLLCCIPVVTIGPAQSGLYNAMRILQDRQDDSSPIKAFFRGFKNGFLSISIVSTLFLVFDVVLFWTLAMCYSYADTGMFIHWGIPFAGLLLSLVVHSNLTIFHSQFQCTAGQLVRNAFLVLISHPLRSVAVTALTWAPVVLFLIPYTVNLFLQLVPLFITVYYSLAFMFGALVMQKPFKKLIDSFYEETEGEEATSEEIQDEEE